MKVLLLLLGLLILDSFDKAISSQADNLHGARKCEALGLCSLGHVKPFLGDIYNSEFIRSENMR